MPSRESESTFRGARPKQGRRMATEDSPSRDADDLRGLDHFLTEYITPLVFPVQTNGEGASPPR